jgi:hypothetical protein
VLPREIRSTKYQYVLYLLLEPPPEATSTVLVPVGYKKQQAAAQQHAALDVALLMVTEHQKARFQPRLTSTKARTVNPPLFYQEDSRPELFH